MSRRKMPLLLKVDQEVAITENAAPEFLFQLKRGLMIALLELGSLDQRQYEIAIDLLERQYE